MWLRQANRWVWALLSVVLAATVALTAYLTNRSEPSATPTAEQLFLADAPDVVGMPMRQAIKSLHKADFEVLAHDRGTVTRQEVGTLHGIPWFFSLTGTRRGGRSVCPDFYMTCPVAPEGR